MTDEEKKVCQKKCKLDKQTNTCVGCGRTMQEIIQSFEDHKANQKGKHDHNESV